MWQQRATVPSTSGSTFVQPQSQAVEDATMVQLETVVGTVTVEATATEVDDSLPGSLGEIRPVIRDDSSRSAVESSLGVTPPFSPSHSVSASSTPLSSPVRRVISEVKLADQQEENILRQLLGPEDGPNMHQLTSAEERIVHNTSDCSCSSCPCTFQYETILGAINAVPKLVENEFGKLRNTISTLSSDVSF